MNELNKKFKEQCKNFQGEDVHFAFLHACKNEDFDFIKYLVTSKELKKRADINFLNGQGFVCLCSRGRLDIIQYLMESSKVKEDICIDALYKGFLRAIVEGHLDIVEYLSLSVDFSSYDYLYEEKSRILLAATFQSKSKNAVDILKYLLNSPELKPLVDVHDDDNSPFISACLGKKIELIDYILSLRGEQIIVFQKTKYNLDWAMKNKLHTVVESMMNNLVCQDINEYLNALPLFHNYAKEHQLNITIPVSEENLLL